MKNITYTILFCSFSFALKAQLVLNKAFTPPNGNYYFEIANNSTTPASVGCYSLISYYQNASDRGFYVITLPNQTLAADGVLTIGSAMPSYQNNSGNHTSLSFQNLFADGLLQRHIINPATNSFINTTTSLNGSNPFYSLANDVFDDHLVLLFNGNTLIDASFTVDARNNLSQFLRLLPNLSFTNTCGGLVTVRFGALQSMYASIFNRPYEPVGRGYFKEFQVQRNNATVQVAWKTIREQNNRGFEIERRTGDEPWTTVAFIATLAPNGNSSQTLDYLYGDNTWLRDKVQYRLKQIDNNGRTTYSPIQSLNDYGVADKVIVYPNPSTDGRVNIAFGNVNSLRDVQVLDINGRLIQQWLSVNNSTQEINNLRRGNYIIRIIDRQTGNVFSKKLLVQ